jgi:hypothetical protein
MRIVHHIVRTALAPLALAAAFSAPVWAEGRNWTAERDVEAPSYAYVDPRTSDLNIDTVVLTCEPADEHSVLQLQLYLSNDGPLIPANATANRLKTEPRAEISIDDKVFPVELLFAGDHVVLADETDRLFPRLSNRLLDALEEGSSMTLRFDLVAESVREPAAFDGEAVIGLRDAGSASAIAAVRQCGVRSDLRSASLGELRR